ncbi:MAG: phosphatidylserine/phosphatidylglycerophosphate/cardiolipin synthase family protein [bacterium]|nr:phosphatidylserine/phosphatidylglycerophosphate/cardiolipin synthase family protein [bacterium]
MAAFLQSPHEFLEDFIVHALVATDRVWIQAMVFEVGAVSERLCQVLIDAARRGCDVRFQVDWNSSQYVDGELRLLPEFDLKKRTYADKVHKTNENFYAVLRAAGVSVTILNSPFIIARLFPIYKRNHTKLYIADGMGWMGGMNLYDEAFDNIDFMVRFDDSRIVSALIAQFEQVNQNKPKKNYAIKLSENYTFLADSGRNGESIIYDTALECIDGAIKSIVFVSQIVPEGVLLERLLLKAAAGIPITIITSPRGENQFRKYPQKYFYDQFKKLVANNPNIHFTHLLNTLHAKLILVDSRIGLFGSHNFVEQGVLLGTEEICMQTEDPQLISQLTTFASL